MCVCVGGGGGGEIMEGGPGPIFSKRRGGPKKIFTMIGGGSLCDCEDESTMWKI